MCPGSDYEYQLSFALSRLDLQKNINALRYKRVPNWESYILHAYLILNKMK